MMGREEQADRVRAALAEAGFPELRVWIEDGTVWTEGTRPEHDAAIWRAYALADPSELGYCWPCLSSGASTTRLLDCDHDPLTSEWPPVPERV